MLLKIRFFLVRLFAGKSIAIGQPSMWIEGTMHIDQGSVLRLHGFNIRNSELAVKIDDVEASTTTD